MNRRQAIRWMSLGSLGLAACSVKKMVGQRETLIPSITSTPIPVPTQTDTPQPTLTITPTQPAILIGEPGDESPFVGLKYAKGRSVISGVDFERENPGCIFIHKDGQPDEMPLQQFLGKDENGNTKLAGSAVDPKYLEENVFNIVTAKDGFSMGRYKDWKIFKVNEFTYIAKDDRDNIIGYYLNLAQGVSGVKAVYEKNGNLMEGWVDPNTSTVLREGNAFVSMTEIAQRENFNQDLIGDLQNIASISMEGAGGKFTGRLQVGTVDARVINQKFLGDKKSEAAEMFPIYEKSLSPAEPLMSGRVELNQEQAKKFYRAFWEALFIGKQNTEYFNSIGVSNYATLEQYWQNNNYQMPAGIKLPGPMGVNGTLAVNHEMSAFVADTIVVNVMDDAQWKVNQSLSDSDPRKIKPEEKLYVNTPNIEVWSYRENQPADGINRLELFMAFPNHPTIAPYNDQVKYLNNEEGMKIIGKRFEYFEDIIADMKYYQEYPDPNKTNYIDVQCLYFWNQLIDGKTGNQPAIESSCKNAHQTPDGTDYVYNNYSAANLKFPNLFVKR